VENTLSSVKELQPKNKIDFGANVF
jgi:hypothetical protein